MPSCSILNPEGFNRKFAVHCIVCVQPRKNLTQKVPSRCVLNREQYNTSLAVYLSFKLNQE